MEWHTLDAGMLSKLLAIVYHGQRTIRLRGGGDNEDEVVDGVVLIKSDNATGYKGVRPNGKKFMASIGNNHLGTFDTAQQAAVVYAKAKAEVDKAEKAKDDATAEAKAEAKKAKDDAMAEAKAEVKKAKEAAKNSPLKKAQAKKAKLEANLVKVDAEIAALMAGLEVDDADADVDVDAVPVE